MESDEFIVYHRSERKRVEKIQEVLVNEVVILGQNLVSKIEVQSHLLALVVASQKKSSVGPANLDAQKQNHHFQRVLTAIHIISEKQVFVFDGFFPQLDYLQQVVILAMNVSNHIQRVFQE